MLGPKRSHRARLCRCLVTASWARPAARLLTLAWLWPAAGCARDKEPPAPAERSGSLSASYTASAATAFPAAAAGTRQAPTSTNAKAAAPVASAPRVPAAGALAAPSSSAPGCAGAPPKKAWLTSAGCVRVQRCPGVPGPCTTSCVPFPKQCESCASCDCVSKALCGRGAAPFCRGYEVVCAEP